MHQTFGKLVVADALSLYNDFEVTEIKL